MSLTTDRAAELVREFGGRTRWEGPDCSNRRPGRGWAVVGHAGFTLAIKAAGIPTYRFWSGANPTPSTQAPGEVVRFCWRVFARGGG
jgi:hypothetical protein